MAQVVWAHLCDYAFFDQGHKPCLIGIFQHIVAPRVPTTHTRAALALEVHGEVDETVTIGLRLLRPDRGELFTLVGPPVLLRGGSAGRTATHTMIANLDNMLLPEYGPFTIEITLNGQLVHCVEFTVERGG